MKKLEALDTDWTGINKLWVLEVKEITIKSPFKIDIYDNILLYPTGQIWKSDMILGEFSQYKYIRARLTRFDDHDPRNYSFSCARNDSVTDNISIYNYFFNKFRTYEEAEYYLPTVRKKFEEDRERLYKKFQDDCSDEINRFYAKLDLYTQELDNLKNNILSL